MSTLIGSFLPIATAVAELCSDNVDGVDFTCEAKGLQGRGPVFLTKLR
jgi:hypothetical protein